MKFFLFNKGNLNNKKNVGIIIYCLICSFLVLMITSRSSFLYPLNNWGDANAFFTMGKSFINGKIIFKDIFEQKGPMLYLIYGIGYLISNKSFLGIFILEIISTTVFLYYSYKVLTLYLNEKYAYIILPIFVSLVYSSKAFSCGGSCEEFAFPLLIYTIYQLLNMVRNGYNYKKIYLVGLCTGIIFLLKYTMIGFGFAFSLYMLIMLLIQKKYKQCFLSITSFLLGILTIIIPWLIYFLSNGALYDFINCYIIINAKSYGFSNVSIIERLVNCIYYFARNLYGTGLHLFIAFASGFLCFINKKITLKEKLSILTIVFFSVLFTYIGGTYLSYYILPLLIFIIFSFIGIGLLIKKDLKINKIIYLIFVIFSMVLSYLLTPNKFLIGIKKENMPQYKFAEIINKHDTPTILNYGGLDMGFYTVTGIIPNTKYFEKLNFKYEKYPDNVDSLNNYIEKKEVDFVIFVKNKVINFPITDYLELNYIKVAEYSNYDIDNTYTYYLYELKK